MKQIVREHFGRGVSDDAILNDVRMTILKIQRENPRPDLQHIELSPERRIELLQSQDLGYSGYDLFRLLGLPVYLNLELENDEAGYRVVHAR